MLLETEQKPLGEDVSVKIPPVDSGKFVNRLNDGVAKTDASPKGDEPAKNATASPASSDAAPARAQKYDTQIPDSAPAAPAAEAMPATPSASAETTVEPAAAAPVQTTKSASAESSKAAAAASHPSNEAPKPAHTANASAPRDGFAVQLAAFTHDREANSLAGRLKKAGYAAYTEPLKTSKGTMWRVRVGPYPSRDAAVAARDKLKAEGEIGIVAAIK
jgi:DedD protein